MEPGPARDNVDVAEHRPSKSPAVLSRPRQRARIEAVAVGVVGCLATFGGLCDDFPNQQTHLTVIKCAGEVANLPARHQTPRRMRRGPNGLNTYLPSVRPECVGICSRDSIRFALSTPIDGADSERRTIPAIQD